jgi:hypothetical protein
VKDFSIDEKTQHLIDLTVEELLLEKGAAMNYFE